MPIGHLLTELSTLTIKVTSNKWVPTAYRILFSDPSDSIHNFYGMRYSIFVLKELYNLNSMVWKYSSRSD
jgi:hypothetical protein